jgi:hypothetical protein
MVMIQVFSYLGQKTTTTITTNRSWLDTHRSFRLYEVGRCLIACCCCWHEVFEACRRTDVKMLACACKRTSKLLPTAETQRCSQQNKRDLFSYWFSVTVFLCFQPSDWIQIDDSREKEYNPTTTTKQQRDFLITTYLHPIAIASNTINGSLIAFVWSVLLTHCQTTFILLLLL